MNVTRENVGLGMICLAFCLSTPAIATAGQVLPTWSQQVYVTGLADSYVVDQEPATFLELKDTSEAGLTGQVLQGLVDYQDYSGPVVIHVIQAYYAPVETDPPLTVPLVVYAFPASAQPPQLDNPPIGAYLTEIDIPYGNYYSSSYSVTLPGQNTGGSECFLLSCSDVFADVPGRLLVSTVPEPSSFLMLGTATVILAACALRRVSAPGKKRGVAAVTCRGPSALPS